MSNPLDDLASVARAPRASVSRSAPVQSFPPRSGLTPGELFRQGFFWGLGWAVSAMVFSIGLLVLLFVLSFAGCSLIGSSAPAGPVAPGPFTIRR